MVNFLRDLLGGLSAASNQWPAASQARARLGFEREQQADQLERDRLAAEKTRALALWKIAIDSGDKYAAKAAWKEVIRTKALPIEVGEYSIDTPEIPALEPPEDDWEAPSGVEPITIPRPGGEATMPFSPATPPEEFPSYGEDLGLPPMGIGPPKGEKTGNFLLDAVLDKMERERKNREDLARNTMQKWTPLSDNAGFYRTNEHGESETIGNPLRATMRKKLLPDIGKIEMEDGSLIDMPEDMKTAFARAPKQIYSVDWDTSTILYKDGTEGVLSPQHAARHEALMDAKWQREQKKIDYRFELSTKLRSENLAARLNQEHAQSALRIYNDAIDDLRAGKVDPVRALANAKRALQIRQVPNAEGLAAHFKNDFGAYAFNVDFDAKERDLLNDYSYLQVASDEIAGLLRDDIVRGYVGRYRGRFGEFERQVTGEAGLDPKVVRFRMMLNDTVDIVRRTRSGAAINPWEKDFYNDLLGSELRDPDALIGRMETLIDIAQMRQNVLWRAGLQRQYGLEGVTPDLLNRLNALILYQAKNRRESALPTGLTDEDMKNE